MIVNEKELIEQVSDIVCYNCGREGQKAPYVKDMIKAWAQAKQFWIDKWYGPILDCGMVSFELSETDKVEKFKNFLSRLDASGQGNLSFFLDQQGCESFWANKVSYENDKSIPVGSKLIKAFKYYVIGFDEDLRYWQDAASVLIQSAKCSGTLCLSVHPLDYLSISENTYNWRSCHALDGDYAAGNLNYMLDRNTVVAYIKGEDNVKLPHFPESVSWNSKKWRMLITARIPNLDIVFASRQYPMHSDFMLHKIREELINNCSDFSRWCYSDWTSKFINCYDENSPLSCRYFYANYSLLPLEEVVTECNNFLGYNDILYSTVDKGRYFYREGSHPATVESLRVRVGESAICPFCGKRLLTIFRKSLCCENCYRGKD